MKEIVAKQFTPLYDEREDRMRLAININFPERYDIWITRAFLIKILDNVDSFWEKECLKEVTDQTFQACAEVVHQPVNEAKLLEAFTIHKQKNSYLLILSDGKARITAFLEPGQLSRLFTLLKSKVRYIWGLGF